MLKIPWVSCSGCMQVGERWVKEVKGLAKRRNVVGDNEDKKITVVNAAVIFQQSKDRKVVWNRLQTLGMNNKY